jgi:hypothetical protein
LVTSPHAMIAAELPADGAAGRSDSAAIADALGTAEPGEADAGAIDASAAARIAIE